MLALLQYPPENDAEWAIWSYNNYDALNQIRQAILAQKGITLAQYQVEPIAWSDIDTWLDNNQQSHTDFAGVLGIQTSDLLHTDLRDPNQRQAWTYLNFQELQSACQILKIGP